MRESSCTIRLQHERAQSFFDEAMHPNLDELHRRDDFLADLAITYPVCTEGTDLVVKISDIDITSLLSESDKRGYTRPCVRKQIL